VCTSKGHAAACSECVVLDDKIVLFSTVSVASHETEILNTNIKTSENRSPDVLQSNDCFKLWVVKCKQSADWFKAVEGIVVAVLCNVLFQLIFLTLQMGR